MMDVATDGFGRKREEVSRYLASTMASSCHIRCGGLDVMCGASNFQCGIEWPAADLVMGKC